jgi:hypothetical protein
MAFVTEGCTELKNVLDVYASSTSGSTSGLSTSQISSGLKEALTMGIEEGITKLSAADGFYKNQLVKILLPEKLQKVESTLRSVGLGSLADEGLKLLNRAAEDAVKEGAPIFANAITSITFDDAKKILFGDSIAATTYLKSKTAEALAQAFMPKVQASLSKVGADKAWSSIMSTYNTFSSTKITTDLSEYVTNETISGVFKMVAEKESGIRSTPALRTTAILKDVFGALDK